MPKKPEPDEAEKWTCDNCGKEIVYSDGRSNGVVIGFLKSDETVGDFPVCFDCSPEQATESERLTAMIAAREKRTGRG